MSSHSKDPSLPSSSTSIRGGSPSGGDGDGRGAAPATRYKGVRKRKWGSWVAEVRRPNSRARIWLGSYDTPEKAARAYDAAVVCLRGTRATFNFPDSLPAHIPAAAGGGLTHDQIREVAARHARGEAVPCQEAELAVERTGEGADVGVEGGNFKWPEDPLAGFPSPSWSVHYTEGADDSSPEGSGGETYSLWSFSSDDGPPFASS